MSKADRGTLEPSQPYMGSKTEMHFGRGNMLVLEFKVNVFDLSPDDRRWAMRLIRQIERKAAQMREES